MDSDWIERLIAAAPPWSLALEPGCTLAYSHGSVAMLRLPTALGPRSKSSRSSVAAPLSARQHRSFEVEGGRFLTERKDYGTYSKPSSRIPSEGVGWTADGQASRSGWHFGQIVFDRLARRRLQGMG